jgi:uncharacterized membrane protein
MLPVSSAVVYWQQGASTGFFCLLASAAVYVVGVFGVTIFGNVPLNEMLDKFNINGSVAGEVESMRLRFEHPWNKLNLIRTLANVLSFILLTIAFWNVQAKM